MKLSDLLPILALSLCTLFLCIWGGGVFLSSVCLSVTVLCLATGFMFFARARAAVACRPPLSAFAGGALLLAVLLSAAPLPGRLDTLTGGRRRVQNDRVRQTLSEAREHRVIERMPVTWFSHTRNRAGTLRIALLLVLALCAAAITAGLSQRARTAYLCFLTVILVLISVLGFLHQWIWPAPKTFWWLFRFPYGSPVGCFVNRTHHAGFIAMICPVALALLVLSVNERRWGRTACFAVAFVVMLTAVLSSLSRGAVLAVAAGVLAVVALAACRRNWRALLCLSVLMLCLGLAATVGLTAAGNRPVFSNVAARLGTFGRLTRTFSGRARLTVWRDSLKVWRDYPLTGVGPNGFRMVFPSYRTRSDRKTFITPENEYVEILVDGGAVGVLLTGLLAALLVSRWRHETKVKALAPEVSLAAAGAAAVAFVHNGVDFPMHNPLYAMTVASLAGMIFPRPAADGCEPFHAGPPVPRRLTAAVLLVIAFAVGGGALFCGTAPYKRDLRMTVVTADAADLSESLVCAPTSWATWYHFGRLAFDRDERPAHLFGERCMTRAAEYDPNNYRLWEALGDTRLNLGLKEEARQAFDRMHALRSWKKPPKIP